MYKFITQSNTYEKYEIVETKTFSPVNCDILPSNPYELKLFPNDTFNISGDTIIIEHSNLKQNQYISGILDLNMTHGKYKNKFLYICKPDDKRIPYFVIPYNIPYSFDKSIKQLYITFQFVSWESKYPQGSITQNLGCVNELSNYYEYVLYCKSLSHSLSKFSKDTKMKLSPFDKKNIDIIDKITEEYQITKISDNEHVFTIDSVHSNDFDDAISYVQDEHRINIYISNVAIIMDYLDLWDSFSNRVSSIYLPDRKRSMIPNMLTEKLCSLKEGSRRICYRLSIFYDEKESIILEQKLDVCNVLVHKNYNYDNEDEYTNRHDFKRMQRILKSKGSKDVVTKLMLHFNHYIATVLVNEKYGIFKSLSQAQNHDIPKDLPIDIYNHISMIRNQASLYTSYDKQNYKSIMHKNIGVYLQSTSPIRRLVDLLNNIVLCYKLGLCVVNNHAIEFYEKWTSEEKLDYINTASRAIRKIQSKCKIYNQHEINRKLGIEPVYEGYIFDKIIKEGDGKFQYMVYLKDINLTTYITLLDEYENFSIHNFKLYVFMNEENDKKKIKLQLCYESSR
jgi:hypothetical protein